MKRGAVVWVDLSDTNPPEMGKVRPGIVVSGTAHNEILSTVVVVPTSSVAPEIRPLRVAVGRFGGKESYAVIPGIRQVRKGRLRGVLGELGPEQLLALDECLDAYLR
ncbi:MAG: type II toxin-antitoxin system PemK/MazF family toxin [Acidobacteriia bacterium]|nr:type II toxin-antitoxin system PemK/MazF family toxin [Terriglobia bacterium]